MVHVKEEIQQNLVNPFQNVFHQQPSEIQREAEIEIQSNIKKKTKQYVCEYENCGKTYRSKENFLYGKTPLHIIPLKLVANCDVIDIKETCYHKVKNVSNVLQFEFL